VTRDVPDYSVVAGNPAKVLRRFDTVRGEWTAVR
jgi:acetyltransferase-like isoleucine patch superfamily enzyme